MNLAKGNTNELSHLVPQCQKEVIEEDCRGRDCVILVTIVRSQSQK